MAFRAPEFPIDMAKQVLVGDVRDPLPHARTAHNRKEQPGRRRFAGGTIEVRMPTPYSA